MQDVAKKFPSNIRDRYVKAGQLFRLPYFDWAARLAAGASAFPNAIASPKITVIDTDGQTKSIDNPLYTFNFAAVKPAPGDFDRQVSLHRFQDSNRETKSFAVESL